MQSNIILFVFMFLHQTTFAVFFPQNKQAIRNLQFDDLPSLTVAGREAEDEISGLQLIKTMHVAGREMVVIGARAKILFIDPTKLTPSDSKVVQVSSELAYDWQSDDESKESCIWKGQTKDACENFVKVVESIDENGDNLFICGTNAYNPICKTFNVAWNADGGLELEADEESIVSGKEKCPFGPDQSGASLYSDGSLYTSTAAEFKARTSVVSKSKRDEDEPILKTSRHDRNLLNKPTFVSMMDAGDRILVFMNEKVDNDDGDMRLMSKVAQVCKNDQGGEHVLVHQWTTFLKTRLNCSYHGFYFDQLQAITEPMKITTSISTKQVVFATFTSPDFAAPASAVCMFAVDDIREAMTSSFKTDIATVEVGDPTPPSADRHPGLCKDNKFSPEELQFIKSHPHVTKQVSGQLLSTDTDMRWTAMAVDAKAGPSADYTVMFLGTSEGKLVRYLNADEKVLKSTPLSTQDVYDEKKCGVKSNRGIQKIIVNKATKSVAISFSTCIVNVPMHTCRAHANEEQCVMSADPYCGWNGETCIFYSDADDKFSQNLPMAANNPSIITELSASASQDEGGAMEEESEVEHIDTQADDAEVELSVDANVGNNSPQMKSEEKLAFAGHAQMATDCPPPSMYAIIAVVTFVLTALGFGLSCWWCGRKHARQTNSEDIMESKVSLADKVRKTTNIIQNFSPHRNRKNELNNTHSSTPLVSSKTSSDNLADSIVQDKELNNTLLRSTSKGRSSRMNSTNSYPSNPPRYSTLQRSSQASADIHNKDNSSNIFYTESDTLRFGDSSEVNMTLQRQSVSGEVLLNNSTLPKKATNTIERRKKAENQAIEIMRDSAICMQSTEQSFNTLSNMVKDDGRDRLNSDDSGKGDSPRNSLKTEEEKSKVPPKPPSPSAKPTRPMSLGIVPGTQNNTRRTRLNSEPTRELPSPSYKPSHQRLLPQRTHSMMSNRPPPHYATTGRQVSQPATPNGKQMYSPAPPAYTHQQQMMNPYSTLPKHQNTNQHPLVPQGYRRQMSAQPQSQNPNLQQNVLYERYSYPQHKYSSLPLRRSKGNHGQAYSIPAKRGSNGSEYASSLNGHNTLTRQSSQPQQHYSTLQHPRSNNNVYTERQSTLQRREKLPNIMRQTSNQTNPKFVPTPKIPNISEHGTIDENCAV